MDPLSGQRIVCSSLLRMPQPVVPVLPELSFSTSKSAPTLVAAASDTKIPKEQPECSSETATPMHPNSTPVVSPRSILVSTIKLPQPAQHGAATATAGNRARAPAHSISSMPSTGPGGIKLECSTAVLTRNVSGLKVTTSSAEPDDRKLCTVNKPSANGHSTARTSARSSTILKANNKRSVGNKENVSISSKDSRKSKRSLF